jgi:hypothetical protein
MARGLIPLIELSSYTFDCGARLLRGTVALRVVVLVGVDVSDGVRLLHRIWAISII